MKPINAYHLIVIAAIIVVLKCWYREAAAHQPVCMLAPVTSLVETAIGKSALFVSGEGYYFPALHIIINKSCSGLNFFCICFFLLGFTISGYPFKGKYAFYLLVLPLLLLSYIITLFVNFSRILFAMFVNAQATHLEIVLPEWFHMAEGVFVYLFFLILVYLLTHILFTKLIFPYEKPV